MNNSLNNKIINLDKDNLKLVGITLKLRSIEDNTYTIIHAEKNSVVSISQKRNGLVTGNFMYFPENNNISLREKNTDLSDDFDEEESTNDEYEDELNTSFDGDDGIYLDEEDRADAEYEWGLRVAENYWREKKI